jgi:hypothetical protein
MSRLRFELSISEYKSRAIWLDKTARLSSCSVTVLLNLNNVRDTSRGCMKSWIQSVRFPRSKLHEGKSFMSGVTEGVYSPSASDQYPIDTASLVSEHAFGLTLLLRTSLGHSFTLNICPSFIHPVCTSSHNPLMFPCYGYIN